MNNDDEMFNRLRALKSGLRSEPQDMQVTTLIAACLAEGVHEGRRIVGIVSHLGYNRDYVGIQLKGRLGNNPARHDWQKDANGLYQPLPGSNLF